LQFPSLLLLKASRSLPLYSTLQPPFLYRITLHHSDLSISLPCNLLLHLLTPQASTLFFALTCNLLLVSYLCLATSCCKYAYPRKLYLSPNL
jgi:hypothetical protein